MQDASAYGNSIIFTVKDARALRARFISLVLERDELSAELEAHRLVLAELEELRQFLAGDPAPFTAVAQTNGHLHTASVQADAASDADPTDNDLSDTDVEPELDDDRATMDARSQLCTGEMAADDRHSEHAAGDADAVPEFDANSVDDDPAARDRELDDVNDVPLYQPTGRESALADDDPAAPKLDDVTTEPKAEPSADELCGETAADDGKVVLQNPPVSADCNQANDTAASEADTPADERQGETEACDANGLCDPPSQNETPSDERQGEPEACENDAGVARPLEGTLMARILELIEASDRPKRPWQIQKELRLSRMPSAELSRLLTMGCLTRPKEGIYAVPGRNYGGSVSTEGNQS